MTLPADLNSRWYEMFDLDGSGNPTIRTVSAIGGGVGTLPGSINDRWMQSFTTDGSGNPALRVSGLGAGSVTHTTGALTLNQLVIGNADDDVKVLGTLGTTTTVLHGNAGGAPTFAAVSLTLDVTGTLAGINGGTGLATAAVGDVIYASATTPTWSRLADVAVGSYLRSGGVNTAPLWSTLKLPNSITANEVVFATSTNTYGASPTLIYDLTTFSVGGGRIALTHGTANTVTFGAIGEGAPGTAAGTKIQLRGTIGAYSTSDNAIGCDTGLQWYNTPASHRFYTTGGTRLTIGATSIDATVGDILLTHATRNTIFYGNTGVAVPGAASVGQKIQIYGTAGTIASSDYAIGTESGALWFNTANAIKWYLNSVLEATLDNTGKLTLPTVAATATASLTLGTASSAAGQILFKNASNSNTLTIAGGVTSGAYTLTFPLAAGAAGTVVSTTGSGTLAFTAISAVNIFPLAIATLPDDTDTVNDPARIRYRVSTGSQTTNAPKMTDVVWLMSTALDEAIFFQFVLPQDYGSGGTLRFDWSMATDDSGNMNFKAGTAIVVPASSDTRALVSDTVVTLGATAIPGTLGQSKQSTLALTMTNAAAGRKILVWIASETTSTTATGDAVLESLSFEYVRA